MVRKIVVLVAVMCVATAAWAGPKDKSKGTLVNNTGCRGIGGWDNEVVKASYQADANKMKIKWKGTGATLDGKTVYCFLGAKSYLGDAGPMANALVMVGVVDGEKMSMQGAVASVALGVVPDTVQYDSTLDCYVDPSGTYDPAAECSGSSACGGFPCLCGSCRTPPISRTTTSWAYARTS